MSTKDKNFLTRYPQITTDRANECTKRHGGTSAAAPNAVGVFALALQAR